MKTRLRELRRAAPPEDVLDDALAGPVGGVRLAGEDELDRPVLVGEEAREALLVGEDHRGALVRREAAREADRQDVRVERLVELLRSAAAPRRGARTGSAAGRGENAELAASGAGGPPRARPSGCVRAAPSSARPRGVVEVVEVGVEVPRRARGSGRRPRSAGGCRW